MDANQLEIDRFQFISAKNAWHKPVDQEHPDHGHFIVPLIRHNKQIGLFTLYPKYTSAMNVEEKHLYLIMKIHWPYQLLLLLFLIFTTALMLSPSFAVKTLADAVNSNDKKNWSNLVNREYFKKYNNELLEGLIRVKMNMEIHSGKVGRATAMQDFTFAMSGLNRLTDKLSNPEGFKYIVCGEVARFPNLPEKHDTNCWVMDGDWHWQSPTLVNVKYHNPATGWNTQVQLKRLGLFNWQAVSIELPIEDMLQQFEAQFAAM